jgi:energy-coupling factor transporter ATP-binding protein EcfA2
VSDKSRDEALRDLTDLRSLGLAVPQLPDLFCRLGRPERPLTAEDAPLLALRGGEKVLEGRLEKQAPSLTVGLLHKDPPNSMAKPAVCSSPAVREGIHQKDVRDMTAPICSSPTVREGIHQNKLDAPLVSSAAQKPLQYPASTETCVIRSLVFRYAKNSPPVLRDLNLVFHKSDRVALMGANGSGKSTLLHLLAGTLKATTGALEWILPQEEKGDSRTDVGGGDGLSGIPATGECQSPVRSSAFRRHNAQDRLKAELRTEFHPRGRKSNSVPRAGLVLQVPDLMLFQETVADEIRFAPWHLGVPAPECDEITRDILGRMGLSDLADEAPFSLSRGQRLRAAVGSVLSMRPRVLLLDEPTTGQDREQIERMMDGLAEGFDLVVFCTHDVDTAARHSNRVIVLAEGGVLLDGPPGEVLFDAEGLARARIRQTSVLRYASRLGVRALGVGELVEILK